MLYYFDIALLTLGYINVPVFDVGLLNIAPINVALLQFKLIIPRWSYYFEFIVFVLLSYNFLGVINRHILKNDMFIRAF